MARELLRQLPAIDQWLRTPQALALCDEFSRAEVVAAMREHIGAARRALENGYAEVPDFGGEKYLAILRADILSRRSSSLQSLINATGIVIHTNLGRSPLAEEALSAIDAVARGYSNLEYELAAGERGTRYAHVESLLTSLTGAEAAVVVNNCAAAVTLALRTFAGQAEIVVSRGELIEIGGSFRMPDVIAESGAAMIEVGTTNRTTLKDYAAAIGDNTKAVLSSHTSNYRVIGFTDRPGLDELARLAHSRDCLCIQDLGSGSLVDLSPYGLGDEPTVADSIRSGVDLVTFSGDKLLGGPQAGIIAGRRALIDEIKGHPLLRAMRIDKLSLAALAATLRLYMPPHDPFERVPVLRMVSEPKASIERRARRLIRRWRDHETIEASLADDESFAGGGSLPMNAIPTKVIELKVRGITAGELARRLRARTPAVIGRIRNGRFVLDLRTVAKREQNELADAIRTAAQ